MKKPGMDTSNGEGSASSVNVPLTAGPQGWPKAVAENGRKLWTPALVLARGTGKTVKETAKASGVSERTIHRYENDPAFLAEVSRIRHTFENAWRGEPVHIPYLNATVEITQSANNI
jgi:hypothetical protein